MPETVTVNGVASNSPDAVSFCAMGAIEKATSLCNFSYMVEMHAGDAFRSFVGGDMAIGMITKPKCKRDVISTMKKCVAKLEKDQVNVY